LKRDQRIPLLMIVAGGLKPMRDGSVELGKDTRQTCDKALEIAEQDKRALIAITAGEAPRHGDVWMGLMMSDYVHFHQKFESRRMFVSKASEFNTYGEMLKLARMIAEEEDALRMKRNMLRIILIVKWWHAPRAWFLCRHHLKKRGLARLIPVSVVCYRSNAPWFDILIREPGAWIVNIFRILNRP